MAAGLGFKDFTTGEVLTAADVDGYLMQGVWVFASAAARDAAVTSPQEGNFAYLKDTNVTTYYTGSAWANLDTTGMTNPMTTTGDTIYSSSGSTPARLGIGTAGQVLQVNSGATAPEWATPAGGGGMTSIASGSLSGNSLSLTSISGSYNDLFLVLRNATLNGNCEVSLRVNNNSSSVYDSLGLNVTTSTFTGYGGQNATSSGATYFGTSGQGSYILSSKFVDYAKTTTRKQIQTQASYTRHDNAGSETTAKFDTVRDSNAITRIDVLLSNSVDFTGGTYILYGVK